jgi:hypothetical protein
MLDFLWLFGYIGNAFFKNRRGGEIGRRTGLKIQRTFVHAGSIPALGTLIIFRLEAHVNGLFYFEFPRRQ